jgi:hypothetical protein
MPAQKPECRRTEAAQDGGQLGLFNEQAIPRADDVHQASTIAHTPRVPKPPTTTFDSRDFPEVLALA